MVNYCPIWGEPHEASILWLPETRTYEVSQSPRVGNGYKIDEVVLDSSVRSLVPDELERLATWLVDQSLQGVWIPEITQTIIEYVKHKRPLQVHERADRLLKHLVRRSTSVGQAVDIGTEGDRDSFGGWVKGTSPSTWAAMAWSESSKWEETRFFIEYMEDQGWIAVTSSGGGWAQLIVTIKGYSHISDVAVSRDLSQAFVAMWFSDEMKEPYEKGIRPAIEKLGYDALKIDDKPDVDKIDDEIIGEIRRSRFLVADFTHGSKGPRGGVYYEAGFAYGLGLPVIRACRKDIIDRNELHFDVRQYYHVPWTNPDELRDGLEKRIKALIGEGPKVVQRPN